MHSFFFRALVVLYSALLTLSKSGGRKTKRTFTINFCLFAQYEFDWEREAYIDTSCCTTRSHRFFAFGSRGEKPRTTSKKPLPKGSKKIEGKLSRIPSWLFNLRFEMEICGAKKVEKTSLYALLYILASFVQVSDVRGMQSLTEVFQSSFSSLSFRLSYSFGAKETERISWDFVCSFLEREAQTIQLNIPWLSLSLLC